MQQFVAVMDAGVRLEIPFSACVLFHGRDSIGGLALGWRLLEWALPRLSPGQPPERASIVFRTAFPGPGVRDAAEMVARAVTRGSWTVLPPEQDFAPQGVYGRMYFEIEAAGRGVRIWLRPGVLPDEFVLVGRAVKAGDRSTGTLARWRQLKDALAGTVMGLASIEPAIEWEFFDPVP